MTGSTGSGLGIWLGLGATSCLGIALLLYNLVGLVRFLREDAGGEKASGLSIAAWVLSLVGLFLGPCGIAMSLLVLILGRVESGRIYREQSSARSSVPVYLSSVNAAMVIVVDLLISVFAVGAYWSA